MSDSLPQIPKELVDSVVTLLSMAGRPIGTAFVMKHVVVEGDFFDFFYLVTCEHCIKNSVKARFSNGKLQDINPIDWRKSTTGDDVVAVDITDLVRGAGRAIGCINTGSTVRLEEPFFDIGSDLYMLGLFVDVPDTGRNIPIARFGNLSAFANKKLLLRQGNEAERPCHLGDMRSRSGFSGSPVIGYLETQALDGHTNYKNLLFGVHSAQHKERITIFSVDGSKALEIPSSMTRIVPAWIVLDLIQNDEVFAKDRARRKSKDEGQLGIL